MGQKLPPGHHAIALQPPPDVQQLRHPDTRPEPITPAGRRPLRAITQARGLAGQPAAVVVEPSPRHLGIVQELLAPLPAGGNLVNDAHLAALAIEHRCTVVSYDKDFLRFNGVKLETPTA